MNRHTQADRGDHVAAERTTVADASSSDTLCFRKHGSDLVTSDQGGSARLPGRLRQPHGAHADTEEGPLRRARAYDLIHDSFVTEPSTGGHSAPVQVHIPRRGRAPRPALLLKQASRDQHPHHFVAAFQDLMDPAVPHVLLDGIVLQVAVASVHLQGLVADSETFVCSEELGHGAQGHRIFPLLLQGHRRAADHQPRGHQPCGHISQFELQVLVTRQERSKLLPDIEVVSGEDD